MPFTPEVYNVYSTAAQAAIYGPQKETGPSSVSLGCCVF